MYEQLISRQTPGCVVFLLDRSDSMNRPWGPNSSTTLAVGAARAVNKTLFNLGVQSSRYGKVRQYFDVGVFGYGVRPSTGTEGVESALGGPLAGQGLVSIADLMEHPIRQEQVPSVDSGGLTSPMPVWVEPIHGMRTPMCEAISVAGGYVYEWIQDHPDSFPPIVINITDGIVTDSPHGGATLEEWAERLPTLRTYDGASLLFNIFLSPDPELPTVFPSSAAHLPAPGPQLFGMSSVLPDKMIATARGQQLPVVEGGRAFVFNADEGTLDKFLSVGTDVIVPAG